MPVPWTLDHAQSKATGHFHEGKLLPADSARKSERDAVVIAPLCSDPDRVFLAVDRSGGGGGYGSVVLLARKAGHWVVVDTQRTWVS